ncbi:MAG: GAF domain-containing protein [Bacteroidota bacterium]
MKFFQSIRGKLLSAVVAVTFLLTLLVSIQLIKMNTTKTGFEEEISLIRNSNSLLTYSNKQVHLWLFENVVDGVAKKYTSEQKEDVHQEIAFILDSLQQNSNIIGPEVSRQCAVFISAVDSLFISNELFLSSLKSNDSDFEVSGYPDYSDSLVLNDQFVNWLELQFERKGDIGAEAYGSITQLEKNIEETDKAYSAFFEALSKKQKSKEMELIGLLNWITYTTIIFIALTILFLLVGGHFLYQNIISSVEKANKGIDRLSKGNLISDNHQSKDEIGGILTKIQTLSENLAQVKSFADEVGSGDFDSDVQVFDNKGEIGESLANMRDSLKEVSEETKRRNWTNEGVAKFSDLIRKNQEDLQKLSDEVISSLVKYINANQGALFVLQDGEQNQQMAMQSCYAYKRKKFITKEVAIGQGLVGQAWYEKDFIYITEIPENYVDIGSGLGDAKPKCILVMPMITNHEVLGIIELASFQKLKEHEIEFVRNISESIASALSSVKVAENTKNLLEESRQMTEEMQAQEEEMRQNMEELEATQEEVARKNEETGRLLNQSEKKSESLNVLLDLSSQIAQESNLESACQNALYKVCEFTGWPIGHVYFLNKEGDMLTPSNLWSFTDESRFSAFLKATEGYTFEKGAGLPGRVFELEKAQWIEDVSIDPNFPRSEVAKKSGLKGGFAFPILSRNSFLGVMEFFSEKAETLDKSLLDLMDQVGILLGNVFETLERSKSLSVKAEELQEEKIKIDAGRKEVISILDGIQEFIFVFDETGIIKDVNSQSQRILGLKKEDIESSSIEKFFPGINDLLKQAIPVRENTHMLISEKQIEAEVLINSIEKRGEKYYLLTAREIVGSSQAVGVRERDLSLENQTKKALLKTQKKLKNLS